MGKIIDCIMAVANNEVPQVVKSKNPSTDKNHYLRKFMRCILTKKK